MTIRAPAGLDRSGRALWRKVTGDFDLRADEARILADACATADLIDRMSAELTGAGLTVTGSTGQLVAHPLVAALHSHRQLLARLLDQLALPNNPGRDDVAERRARSQLGRAAARSRWQ